MKECGVRLLWLSLAVMSWGTSCGGTAPATEVPEPEPLRYEGSLLALAPSSASYVVHASPQALWQSSGFRQIVDPLFPADRLQAFSDRTGIRIPELREALYADLGAGRFLIACRAESAPDVVRAAGMRMNTIEVSADEPVMRRVGFLGTERRDLAAVGDDLLLVGADATAELAAILRGIEHAELPEAALRGEDGASLRQAFNSPLVVYAPHPLDLPLDSPIGLILAQERAAAIAVRPLEDSLEVRARVIGELPEGAEANFRSFLESLSHSDLGRILGINAALASLEIQMAPDLADLRSQWPVGQLSRAIRVLFTEELQALVEEPVFAE